MLVKDYLLFRKSQPNYSMIKSLKDHYGAKSIKDIVEKYDPESRRCIDCIAFPYCLRYQSLLPCKTCFTDYLKYVNSVEKGAIPRYEN